MRIESAIIIDSSLATVFQKLSKPTDFSVWMQNFRSRTPLGALDAEVGCEAEHIQEAMGRKIKFRERILALETPNLFQVELISSDIEVNVTYSLSALDAERTQVQVVENITLKAFFMRTVAGLVKAMMQKRLDEDLQTLKKYIQDSPIHFS